MSQISLHQTVHTLGGKAYHLEEHLKILFESYYQVFSGYANLSAKEIEAQIKETILRSRCPKDRSLFVTLSLSKEGKVSIEQSQRSLYEGYTLRCVVPRGALVEFELPHIEHPTSIRRALTEFANVEAKRRGGDIAIRSHNGIADLANEAQLFGVLQDEIITSATSYSAEHKMAKQSAISMGLKLVERPILVDELKLLDELFYVDHQGVTALKSCGNRYYMSITAGALAQRITL